jgi:hypothetical protein
MSDLLKQEVPPEVFKIFGILFKQKEYLSEGGTVTREAWDAIYERLLEIQKCLQKK